MSASIGLDELFCAGLPSKPLMHLHLGKILVSGASGYIGGRLVPELLQRGYKVRAIVRADPLTYENIWPGAEIVKADALQKEDLRTALSGIEIAYSLTEFALGFEENGLNPCQDKACEQKNRRRIQRNTPRTLITIPSHYGESFTGMPACPSITLSSKDF